MKFDPKTANGEYSDPVEAERDGYKDPSLNEMSAEELEAHKRAAHASLQDPPSRVDHPGCPPALRHRPQSDSEDNLTPLEDQIAAHIAAYEHEIPEDWIRREYHMGKERWDEMRSRSAHQDRVSYYGGHRSAKRRYIGIRLEMMAEKATHAVQRALSSDSEKLAFDGAKYVIDRVAPIKDSTEIVHRFDPENLHDVAVALNRKRINPDTEGPVEIKAETSPSGFENDGE